MMAFVQQAQIWSTIAFGTTLPPNVPRTSYLFFRTADSTLHISTGVAWRQFGNTGAGGLPTFLEFLGGGLVGTSASGATDSTAFYIAMKMFALNDSAAFDFTVSKLGSLDSIIIIGGTTSTAGDSAAFSLRVKQTGNLDSYVGAFNAAAIDSSDLGAGSVQRSWRFSSFGSLTANKRSTIRGKVWRSACTNNATAKVFVERVLIYGKGLRTL